MFSRLIQFLVLCMASMPLFAAPNIEDFLVAREAQVSVAADLNEHLQARSPYENIIWNGQSHPVSVITQENFPEAYAWYQRMMEKYPEADLDQYSFVVGGQGWAMMPAQYIESKRALIGCPFQN